jgi:hypothetical protein
MELTSCRLRSENTDSSREGAFRFTLANKRGVRFCRRTSILTSIVSVGDLPEDARDWTLRPDDECNGDVDEAAGAADATACSRIGGEPVVNEARSAVPPITDSTSLAKLGPPVATKAMAAKLARLMYRMLRYGIKYVDQGVTFYEAQHRKQQVIHLKRKAAQLGLQIIEVAPAA